MRRTAAAAALLAIALSACQRQDPNNIAIDEGNNANSQVETLPPDETVTNEVSLSENAETAIPPEAASATFPAQYHGRWGNGARRLHVDARRQQGPDHHR
jgi:hypothetical protein